MRVHLRERRALCEAVRSGGSAWRGARAVVHVRAHATQCRPQDAAWTNECAIHKGRICERGKPDEQKTGHDVQRSCWGRGECVCVGGRVRNPKQRLEAEYWRRGLCARAHLACKRRGAGALGVCGCGCKTKKREGAA